LTYYFYQWIYGAGYPNYFFIFDKESKKLIIKQTNTDPSVSFRKIKIPMEIFDGSLVISRTFDFQTDGQEYDISDIANIDSVTIDPDFKIIGSKIVLFENQSIILTEKIVGKNLNLQSIDVNEKIELVYISDMSGKKILEYKSTDNVQVIDVEKLLQGLYIVSVQTNFGWHSLKFIKE
jgi:hypothetical protein